MVCGTLAGRLFFVVDMLSYGAIVAELTVTAEQLSAST
jgi:hypothetical protein